MPPSATSLFTKPVLRIALGIMVVGLFVAGLQPFNFISRNEVSWLKGETGIVFQGYGEAYSTSTLDFFNTPDALAPVSIEFIVSSFEGARRSIETLFTVASSSEKSFALERWTEDLVVAGWFQNKQGEISFQRLFCGQVFDTRAQQFITVTSGAAGVSVYVQANEQRHYPDLFLVSRNFRGTILIGQAVGGHQEWSGVVSGLAFSPVSLNPHAIQQRTSFWRNGEFSRLVGSDPRSLIYSFQEGRGPDIHALGGSGPILRMPRSLHALTPEVVKVPTRRDLEDWSDIAVNVLGFIPFGALVWMYAVVSGRGTGFRTVLFTVIIGFAISLSIEILQVFLPSRDSSLLDVMMNTLGTWIGACFAGNLWHYLFDSKHLTIRA